jgi:SNF2 family DNA or RNA helicase
MPNRKTKLSIQGDRIRISASPDSPLLGGAHRIYLINVLGFDLKQIPTGFELSARSHPQLVRELTEYLSTEGISVEHDQSVKNISTVLTDDAASLEAARKSGAKLKRRLQRTLVIPGFVRSLKPYQIPAVAHLVQVKNGANFSVPGSGKTTMALAAYALLKTAKEVEKIVVIGPRSSFMPWEEEFKGCFGKSPKSVRLVGTRAERKRLYRKAESADLILLTYQLASNDLSDLSAFMRTHKTLLVLDESHNIKRIAGGKWAEAVLQLAPIATRRVVLSGTPVPNSLLDLWSQFTFLWPLTPILGERDQFKTRFEHQGATFVDTIKKELFPFHWRVRKRDLQLPPPRFHRISVSMSRYQSAIYDAIAAKVLSEVVKAPQERITLREWRKARMVRLLQAASNPTLLARYSNEFRIPPLDASGLPVDAIILKYPEYEFPAKLKCAEDLIRRLINKGEKVLVWTAFVHNISTLREMLSDHSPLFLYGAVPRDEKEDQAFNRESTIRDFKTNADKPLLIANPSACSESISLHKICRHAIYLDRTFNAAHYMQSLDRIHRIGLRPSDYVHYYILQSKGTVDEVIHRRLNDKIKQMTAVLDDEFSTIDLEQPEDQFSEDNNEEADFAAIVAQLKSRFG